MEGGTRTYTAPASEDLRIGRARRDLRADSSLVGTSAVPTKRVVDRRR
jgi:hypothetical protein